MNRTQHADAPDIRRDGSSPASAIIVSSAGEEYSWVRRYCPGYTVAGQYLTPEVDGKRFDMLVLHSTEGDERKVYFDISSFYGKGKQPGPPCPYCMAPLRTPKAKQCGNCGMDWHDPSNVVCRKRSSP
jgi:hypothetical protein